LGGTKVEDIKAPTIPHNSLKTAMLEMIALLNDWAKETGITEPSLLNFAVTDGKSVVATRYIQSKTDEAASLYFSTGTHFEEYGEGGHYRMLKKDKRESIILVACVVFDRFPPSAPVPA
jgi:glutamine amidotransferase